MINVNRPMALFMVIDSLAKTSMETYLTCRDKVYPVMADGCATWRIKYWRGKTSARSISYVVEQTIFFVIGRKND